MGPGKKMRRQVLVSPLVLMLCVLLHMPIVSASTKSEMFRTQAVLSLYEGKHGQALEYLVKAINDDPNDFNAIYYRGIVLSRMGHYDEAIKDIEFATKNSDDLEGLYFELGYAHYLDKNLVGAQMSLEQAQRRYPDHAPAKYYLGLTYYLQGSYYKCIQPLARAAELDREFGASAAYLMGDAYIKTKRFKKAETVLSSALENYPDSVYNSSISDLLSGLDTKIKQARPYAVDVVAGFAYDDNVGLFPDDQPLPDNKSASDSRTTLNLNAAYKLFSANNKMVQLGMQLFDSRHASLSEYDLSRRSIAMDMRDKGKQLTWGLRYEFSKSYLDSLSFQESRSFIPNAIWVHNPSLFSLGMLIVRDTDYLLSGQETRSSFNYQFLYRAHIIAGGQYQERYFTGIRLESNNAIDDDFDHQAYTLEAGYERKAGKGSMLGSVSYGARDYTASVSSRKSQNATLNVKYKYPLYKSLLAEGGLTYINNPSDDKAFDYTRSVVSLLVRWSL